MEKKTSKSKKNVVAKSTKSVVSKSKVKKQNKTYVLDTNVLLHDCNAIYAFEENTVILPLIVLEELDKHKTRQDEVGANARQVCRELDKLRVDSVSLHDGVVLPSGGLLKVASLTSAALKALPEELAKDKNDHLIIATVLGFHINNEDVILVSKDINIRVKCDALGLKCEDYKHTRMVKSSDELYTGVSVVKTSGENIASVYEKGGVLASSVGDFYPNEIVVLKSNEDLPGSTLTKCVVDNDEVKSLVPLRDVKAAFGLTPRNKEQQFALDLLYDDNIKLVTLTGAAGNGKSIISVAAALDQLKTLGAEQKFEKFIVMRPIQTVGKEMGFLPGTIEEKMEPWIGPIKDCFSFLMNNKRSDRRQKADPSSKPSNDDVYIKMAQEKGLIEIEAIAYIRGRSIPNAIILIDEAQNLSRGEIKTILTRAGENTKIIVTGDVSQIDNPHVDVYTNGLTYVIEKFKNEKIAGHVTLIKGERSALATISSKIL